MPSTVIENINYFPEKLILRIKFLTGLVYDYKNVPPEVFYSLKRAASKGRFLNFHIRGKFEYDRIN